MRHRRFLWLTISFLCGAFLLYGAGVTGKWHTKLPGRHGYDRPYVFELVEGDGGVITGKVVGYRSAGEIRDGKIEGEKIRFTAENQYMARDVLMTFEGTVEGDEMRLTVTFEDNDERVEVLAKRE